MVSNAEVEKPALKKVINMLTLSQVLIYKDKKSQIDFDYAITIIMRWNYKCTIFELQKEESLVYG